ncbi:MAG: hypothetical protein LBJ87_15120 [bacterium]|nr:hypothetical protein [bacterium]
MGLTTTETERIVIPTPQPLPVPQPAPEPAPEPVPAGGAAERQTAEVGCSDSAPAIRPGAAATS